ncbi:signal peptidase I [Roseomonas sp. BN140053]|uniref:signal peptidase I n=1 Tax=Roseomonas sp. BN140053 TaxID=3391898 RepID=UPI0039E814C0
MRLPRFPWRPSLPRRPVPILLTVAVAVLAPILALRTAQGLEEGPPWHDCLGQQKTYRSSSPSMAPLLPEGEAASFECFDHAAFFGSRVAASSIALNTLHPTLQAGDVVTFRVPAEYGRGTWAKRVIGLPGDVVEIRAGRLLVNGRTADLDPAGTFTPAPGQGAPRPISRETLPNGRSYVILAEAAPREANMPAVTVPAGHLFVLGDFRDRSLDSRVGRFGFVPVSHLIARLPPGSERAL